MSAALDLSNINIIFELERMKRKFEPCGPDEYKLCCPFHDDSSPSLYLNATKKLFVCKAAQCAKKGDIVTLLAGLANTDRLVIIEDLKSRYDLGSSSRILNPTMVEKFHNDIDKAGPLLLELRRRGINEAMIRQARIGFYNNRITIPVYDRFNNVINIRRYFPGAPEGEQKFKNTKGYGQIALYQIDQLYKYDTICICGGEIKALAAGYYLNKHGIGCVSSTGGEGSWQVIWNSLFVEKKVFICMDIDAAGVEAAKRISKLLSSTVEGIKLISLPLDPEKFPKGDLSDFIYENLDKEASLLNLFTSATDFVPDQIDPLLSETETTVSLVNTTNPEHVNKRIGFDAIVTAMSDTPYLVPTKISVVCDRKQSFCSNCAIFLEKPDPDSGSVVKDIPITSVSIIEMIETPNSNHQKILKKCLRIPICKSVEFQPISYTKIQDVRLTPQLTIGGLNKGENVVLNAYVAFNIEPELNQPCHFSGTVHPDPKTGKATLVLDKVELTSDSLDTFELTPEILESLIIFRPKEWTFNAISEKLNDLYSCIETDITNIYGRRDMLCIYDLVYHSPLTIIFDGKQIPGWINALIIGDSAQGKSETAVQLIEALGLGEKVDCRNASVAGLIGGLQQLSGRWFITWGVIPLHDRRLLILEEAKGLSIEAFGAMTEVRSSGIAQIPKIERRKALARTRLIFLSNPRSGRQMKTYSFGCEAISELIGSAEDVRRFDIICTLGNGEVDIDYVQHRKTQTGKRDTPYTKELLSSLVLFAWTIDNSEIEFEEEAVIEIYKVSKSLTETYTESFPLVDKGTIRFKIARLSTALAIRTFSYLESKILVRKCHVEYIVKLLDNLYSSPSFGYKDFSFAKKRGEEMKDPKQTFDFICGQKYPKDLVANMLVTDFISITDIMDWLSIDAESAQKIISWLVRKQAIKRINKFGYIKTAAFISFLRANENKFPVGSDQNANGREM